MYPIDLGFKMPPEWSEHSGTIMEWPVREAIWPGPYEEVLEAYTDIVKKISRFEPVILIARPENAVEATHYCGSEIKILEMAHDDSWMRDNGPTFIKNQNEEIAGIDWVFNAWGGKYPCLNDRMIASRLLNTVGIPSFEAPFVMEGGSIHVDGEGTIITTEECLLNSNRNPGLTKAQIENELKKYLGAEKIIWFKKGLFGDDTDGHIDNLACFACPGKIVIQTSSNPENPNYRRSLDNIKMLENETDAMGRKFEIIQVEQPQEDYYEDMYLTLSYLNFYFVNKGIIMPVFGGKHSDTDNKAVETIRRTFPEREVITVNGMPIIRGGGNVHCLTQQMPAGIPAILK